MQTQILVEHLLPHEANIVEEASEGNNIILSGTLMQGDIVNRNRRKYPVNEICNAVSQANDYIKTYGYWPGELGHPAERLDVALDRISHLVTEIRMDGSNAIGRLKLLDTPVGLIAKQLIREGLKLGVSSRGAGNVAESTNIVSGFYCVAIDLVTTPSAPGAMPSPIYEALQMEPHRKTLTLAEQVKQDVDAQKYFQKQVRKFISDLVKK